MTYPCPCQESTNDCWRICPLYRDWQLREGLGSPFAGHHWADPEHPSDGIAYSSIGRENRYQRH
jgi:hypothetical protein